MITIILSKNDESLLFVSELKKGIDKILKIMTFHGYCKFIDEGERIVIFLNIGFWFYYVPKFVLIIMAKLKLKKIGYKDSIAYYSNNETIKYFVDGI